MNEFINAFLGKAIRERLKRENERLKKIRDILDELELNDISLWRAKDRFKEEYEQRINGKRLEIEQSIDMAVKSLKYLKEKIEVKSHE